MDAGAQTITVTLELPRDVYERVSQTAAHERRSLEEMLSRLVAEGLNAHISIRELFESASTQYRARLARDPKLTQTPEEVLQELRRLREKIAHELYPG